MLLLLLLVFFCALCEVKTDSNYGPFVMRFQNMSICKGPKSHDCSVNTLRFYHNDNNVTRLNMTFHVIKDCLLVQIKIQTSAKQLSGDNTLFNYNVRNPCQHYFFTESFRTLCNITDKCVVRKGTYNVDVDVVQVTRLFFGNSFFYGSYNFKTTTLSSKENFSCTKAVILFEKI